MIQLQQPIRLTLIAAVGAIRVRRIGACPSGSAGGTTNRAGSSCAAPAPTAAIRDSNVRRGHANVSQLASFTRAGDTFSYPVGDDEGWKYTVKDLVLNVDILWPNLDPAMALSDFQKAIPGGQHDRIVIQPVTNQFCKTASDEALKSRRASTKWPLPHMGNGLKSCDHRWIPGTTNDIIRDNTREEVLGTKSFAALVGRGC